MPAAAAPTIERARSDRRLRCIFSLRGRAASGGCPEPTKRYRAANDLEIPRQMALPPTLTTCAPGQEQQADRDERAAARLGHRDHEPASVRTLHGAKLRQATRRSAIMAPAGPASFTSRRPP